jgi:hypothetical protein
MREAGRSEHNKKKNGRPVAGPAILCRKKGFVF